MLLWMRLFRVFMHVFVHGVCGWGVDASTARRFIAASHLNVSFRSLYRIPPWVWILDVWYVSMRAFACILAAGIPFLILLYGFRSRVSICAFTLRSFGRSVHIELLFCSSTSLSISWTGDWKHVSYYQLHREPETSNYNMMKSWHFRFEYNF